MNESISGVTTFLSSLFGGFLVSVSGRVNTIRFFFIGITVAFTTTFIYIDYSIKALIIGCGTYTALLFLFKSVMMILHYFAQKSYEVIEPSESSSDGKPEWVDDSLWEKRTWVLEEIGQYDQVMSLLLSHGYSSTIITNFIDFLLNNPDVARPRIVEKPKEAERYATVFGIPIKLHYRSFDLEEISTMNYGIVYLIAIIPLSFFSLYLTFSLRNEFSAGVAWYVAILLSIAQYSIYCPPQAEPYGTTLGDNTYAFTRAYMFIIFSGLWLLMKELAGTVTDVYLFNLSIHWDAVAPLVTSVCRYGIYLLPVLILFGFIGAPLTFTAAFIEAFNSYVFGQGGVAGISDTVFKVLHGLITSSVAWVALKYIKSDFTVDIAIVIAMFLVHVPISPTKRYFNHLPVVLAVSFVYSCLSFLTCYVLFTVFDVGFIYIKWITFGWFVAVEIVYPYLISNNLYFILSFRVFSFTVSYRYLHHASICIFGPILLRSLVSNYECTNILNAIIITASIHKISIEPSIFSYALILSFLTMDYEFLQSNLLWNLAVSIPIASKLYALTAMTRTIMFSRVQGFTTIMDFRGGDDATIDMYILGKLSTFFPFIDLPIRTPAQVWSMLTGSPFNPIGGYGLFLTTSAPRPNYFWDVPVTNQMSFVTAFTRGLTDHPIEAPIYLSLERSIQRSFADIVRSGILGSVVDGNVYLFKSDMTLCAVHVIAISPIGISIQVRGLEYISRTYCHDVEHTVLSEIITSYDLFPNIEAGVMGNISVYDVRSISLPLYMYQETSTDIKIGVLGQPGIHKDVLYLCFVRSFMLLYDGAEHTEFSPDFVSKYRVSSRFVNAFERYHDFDPSKQPPQNKGLANSLFEITGDLLFDETNRMSVPKITKAFSRKWYSETDNIFLQTLPQNLIDIIQLAIDTSLAALLMINSGVAPDIETEDIDVIFGFLASIEEEYVIAPITSPEFVEAFEEEKKMILSIVRDISFARFKPQKVSWNVFQIRHDWLRSIWANDAKQILFYESNSSERASIQSDSIMLNNIFTQLADHPIGYPAHVGPIIFSYFNPISTVAYDD